jgi:SAM-dependent methyltransferase
MRKSKVNLDKVKELYNSNVDEFGLDAKSVGWGTQEKQYLRFKKLLKVIDAKNEEFILNELGCGYGELVRFLETKNYNYSAYYGYDISDKMIEAAKNYATFPNTDFFVSDKLITKADYTITSGIFNVMFDESKQNWNGYIENTLEHMFEQSNKGIAFNLLTSYVDFEAPNLYYANPMYYFDFCKKHLSKYVNLIHDYNLYEWTITVNK